MLDRSNQSLELPTLSTDLSPGPGRTTRSSLLRGKSFSEGEAAVSTGGGTQLASYFGDVADHAASISHSAGALAYVLDMGGQADLAAQARAFGREVGRVATVAGVVNDVGDAVLQFQLMRSSFERAAANENSVEMLDGYVAAMSFASSVASGLSGVLPGPAAAIMTAVSVAASVASAGLSLFRPYFESIEVRFNCTDLGALGGESDANGNQIPADPRCISYLGG